MKIEAKAWKFGDDIDTDQIIPTQYLTLPTIEEISKYTMEPQDETFADRYKAGDIVVGGKNFGCGSSREQAPAVLRHLGVRVIIAQSFARIFFRNCINLGILLIEIKDTGSFNTNDTVWVDTDNAVVKKKDSTFDIVPLSDFLKEIIKSGGLSSYIKEKNMA